MKLIAIFSLLILTITASAKNDKKGNELNGIWKPIKQEMGGTALPPAAFEKETLTIDNQKYTMVAESIDEGLAISNDGKMDIYGKEGVNKGKHFTAIYKLENGQLTICYNLAGDTYPTDFDTKDKQMFFMSVFKRTGKE